MKGQSGFRPNLDQKAFLAFFGAALKMFPDDGATCRWNATKRRFQLGPCYPPDFWWKTFAEQTSAAASLTAADIKVCRPTSSHLKSILIVTYVELVSTAQAVLLLSGGSGIHPVQHLGLSVTICSKLFNDDLAIPEMVRMVRKCQEIFRKCQEMVEKFQEMVRKFQEIVQDGQEMVQDGQEMFRK